MAKPKGWREYRKDGILTIRLNSWEYFDDYANQHLVDYREYIFRGQASSSWPLQPTLHRIFDKNFIIDPIKTTKEHLESFKLAVRGRRGPHPTRFDDENEWWALGQHFGLATPLLDWTYSPFVAAFFAFAPSENGESKHRVVYALQKKMVCKKSIDLKNELGDKFTEPISIFTSMTDENSRLVNQGGLFSKTEYGTEIEKWVRKYYQKYDRGVLIKIIIPNKDRNLALVNLNRMNINHASLFPDLHGSSEFCNMHITTYNWPVKLSFS